MNEATRMQYLDAMGIDMFVPRLILPAAKLSSQCLLPDAPAYEEQAAKLANTAQDGSQTSTVQSVGTLRVLDALRDSSTANRDSSVDNSVALTVTSDNTLPNSSSLPSDGISPSVALNTAKTQSATAEKGTVVNARVPTLLMPEQAAQVHEITNGNRAKHDAPIHSAGEFLSQPAQFMLNLWRVSPDILVVDSQKNIEPLPKEQLLHNILRAIYIEQRLPKADVLNWPMVKGMSKDNSWQSAQEMVSYFLEGRLYTSPVKYIFIFGADAQKAILNAQPEDKNGSMMLTELGSKALYFPSLVDMLLKPKLKNGVWQALHTHYLSSLPSQ